MLTPRDEPEVSAKQNWGKKGGQKKKFGGAQARGKKDFLPSQSRSNGDPLKHPVTKKGRKKDDKTVGGKILE